jgi:hypothetical protein
VYRDWLTEFQMAAGLSSGSVVSSALAVLNNADNPETSAVGFTAGIRSRSFGSPFTSAIANSAYVVNDNPTHSTNAWAFYAEAHKTTATAGSTYALELDTRSLVPTISPTPWQQGDVVAFQIACGAELPGLQYDCSAAIQIAPNPKRFKVGINFMHDCLVGTDGGSGGAQAITMATYQSISWLNFFGATVGSITTDNVDASTGTSLSFGPLGMQIRGSSDARALAYFFSVPGAVNYFGFSAGTASSAPAISALGSDSNIDLFLVPKGSGLVRFGAYTAGVLTPTGYTTIRDAGGTLRRVLIG